MPNVSDANPCAVDVMTSPMTLTATAVRMIVMGSSRGDTNTTITTPTTYSMKIAEIG